MLLYLHLFNVLIFSSALVREGFAHQSVVSRDLPYIKLISEGELPGAKLKGADWSGCINHNINLTIIFKKL